jgi:hypothetical protein
MSPPGAVTLRDVVVDGAGDIHVSGDIAWPATFGTITVTPKAQADVLLLKLSPAGSYLAASSFNAGTHAMGNGIAVDGAGNRFVAGSFEGSSATPPLTNKGNHDAFLAKVSATGALSWITPWGSTDSDACHVVRLNSAGDPIVYGGFEGTVTFGTDTLTSSGFIDYYVARLSGSSGAFSWVASDLHSDYSDIALDASGNTFVVGDFTGTATFGSTSLTAVSALDVFVAKVSPTGTFLWATSAGGPNGGSGRVLAIDSAGRLLVAGGFGGPSTFGGTTLTAANTSDNYVWKLLPP